MTEWNHLNKIISADPIDFTQIQFYLLLSNRSNSNSSNSPSVANKNNFNADSSKNITEFKTGKTQDKILEKKNSGTNSTKR